MRRYKLLFLTLIAISLSGCKNKHDTVEIYNKSDRPIDNIKVETKEVYFYESYEKFTVDDDTIGLTIYFTKDEEEEEWGSELE